MDPVTAIIRVPRRQHTVSRVVLRRFARNGELTVFDRDRSIVCCKGPGGAFFVEDFERLRPVEAEERWRPIESVMPRIYSLIRARTVLEDEAAVSTLIDLMAVHWVRSPAIRLAHERVADAVIENSFRKYEGRPALLSQAYTQRTGLMASTAGELEWTNAELHNIAPGVREKWWSDRAEVNFVQAREIFGRSHLQIGYACADDFLIGDAPVITCKQDHNGLGPHQGVAIGDASEICMPIDPKVIIGLGPEPAVIELDREAVERYNGFQIRTFQRWLGSRPGGPSDHAMRTAIPARTVLKYRPKGGHYRSR
jgi:hypothetical protein